MVIIIFNCIHYIALKDQLYQWAYQFTEWRKKKHIATWTIIWHQQHHLDLCGVNWWSTNWFSAVVRTHLWHTDTIISRITFFFPHIYPYSSSVRIQTKMTKDFLIFFFLRCLLSHYMWLLFAFGWKKTKEEKNEILKKQQKQQQLQNAFHFWSLSWGHYFIFFLFTHRALEW